MTADEKANLDAIERERRKREEALLLLLLLLVGGSENFNGVSRRNPRSVKAAVMHAIGFGGDPTAAIRAVVLGSAELHLPGLIDIATAAMEEAWLSGYKKAFHLADVPAPPMPLPKYSGLNRRLIAQQIADDLVGALSRIVASIIQKGKEKGLTTIQIMAAVGRAFTRYGYTATPPQVVNPDSKGSPGFALAGVATETILTAWNGGYWEGFKNPAVNVRLTAFTHFSVMDHRTSEICAARDHLTLAKDDPYWLTNWPKLHPRCRSIIYPRFDKVDLSDWLPTVPPEPGFGTAPGMAFGFTF